MAVLLLTHVSYRSGRMHRLAETTRAAHAAGVLVVWDLAHSAGATAPGLPGPRCDLHSARRGRLRSRLRLQLPERRSRRAGVRLGASAPHRAHGPRAAAPAAVGVARP